MGSQLGSRSVGGGSRYDGARERFGGRRGGRRSSDGSPKGHSRFAPEKRRLVPAGVALKRGHE